MARGFQSDEDAIFDTSDDNVGGAVDTGPAPGAATDEGPLPEPPVDARELSQAIRDLIPHGRNPAPAPAPVQAPAPAPKPDQQARPARDDQQPLSPREAALLRDLREERARRQEIERGGRQQPQTEQQRRDIAAELFENPEAFVQGLTRDLTQNFSQQLAQVRLDSDLNLAAIRHGDTFSEAFKTFIDQVGSGQDAQTYFRVMNAQSPGEEIVKWHRETSVLREVGEDPAAYRERIRAEIRAELQGQPAQQPAQGQAQQPQAARAADGRFVPRQEVRLPTSTGRMNGSKAAGNHGGEDGSDDAIFADARPRR